MPARFNLWYQDPAARRFVAMGYLPWLAGLSLAWEIAQLPLYTLWTESRLGYIAFAVAHCTVGDVLIGTSALALVLLLTRQRALTQWGWSCVALGTTLAGVTYTVFSEWLNVDVLGSWAYSAAMPVIELGGLRVGASPLLQWTLIPAFALYLPRLLAKRGPWRANASA